MVLSAAARTCMGLRMVLPRENRTDSFIFGGPNFLGSGGTANGH